MLANCSRAAWRSSAISWGQDVGLGEAFGVFQALVLDPEDVQVQLVPLGQFLVGVGAPAAFGGLLAPGPLALVAVGGVVAGHELVQVGTLQGLGLQGVVDVGAVVVDPEGFRPGLIAGRLSVEEEDVGLQGLGVEDADGQAHTFARSAFTFSPIKLRTTRNCSGGISFGQGTSQSSRTLARRSGQRSPQPIVTATSNSTSERSPSDFDAWVVKTGLVLATATLVGLPWAVVPVLAYNLVQHVVAGGVSRWLGARGRAG